jgi:hypothetical protein
VEEGKDAQEEQQKASRDVRRYERAFTPSHARPDKTGRAFIWADVDPTAGAVCAME